MDEHLEWLRTNLQAGDVVSICVVETNPADAVISGHEAERAGDERAYFERCKKAYFEMREKYEPTGPAQE